MVSAARVESQGGRCTLVGNRESRPLLLSNAVSPQSDRPTCAAERAAKDKPVVSLACTGQWFVSMPQKGRGVIGHVLVLLRQEAHRLLDRLSARFPRANTIGVMEIHHPFVQLPVDD